MAPPQPGGSPMMERLLAAAPALLERVGDVVAAAAPWCRAIKAALGPGGAGGAGAGTAPLAAGFCQLANGLLAWAVTVLALVPPGVLAADTARDSPIMRLAPPLLSLVEAGFAAAFGQPGPSLEIDAGMQAGAASVAAIAMRVFNGAATKASGAQFALPKTPGVVAALVRLGVQEPPLFAAGGRRARELPFPIYMHYCRVRVKALTTLSALAVFGGGSRVAKLLANSESLLEAAGASLSLSDTERRYARADALFAKLLAKRCALTAGLLQSAAGMLGGAGALSLRRAIARWPPFLAGCDAALRQERALRADEGRSGRDEDPAVWTRRAGEWTRVLLQQMVGGAGPALGGLFGFGVCEELRAAAAPFLEVARALGAPEGPAAAGAAAAAAAEAGPAATTHVCAACGAADATLRCGGCRAARYCDAECQKRDWRAHKAACRQRQQEIAAAPSAATAAARQQP